MNHSRTAEVHFLQMWVPPDTTDIEPEYEQIDCNAALASGGLVAVASGRGHGGAVRIHQRGAVMWVARLRPGGVATIPDAPFVHVFVGAGEVKIDGSTLAAGDAARLRGAGTVAMTAGAEAEVIVWESDQEAMR